MVKVKDSKKIVYQNFLLNLGENSKVRHLTANVNNMYVKFSNTVLGLPLN